MYYNIIYHSREKSSSTDIGFNTFSATIISKFCKYFSIILIKIIKMNEKNTQNNIDTSKTAVPMNKEYHTPWFLLKPITPPSFGLPKLLCGHVRIAIVNLATNSRAEKVGFHIFPLYFHPFCHMHAVVVIKVVRRKN